MNRPSRVRWLRGGSDKWPNMGVTDVPAEENEKRAEELTPQVPKTLIKVINIQTPELTEPQAG